MNENRKKAIVAALTARLKRMRPGVGTSTALLLKSAFPGESFSEGDLCDVHFGLFEAAEAAGMTLDFSAHENKLEGLPFNLIFILKK